MPDPAAPRFVDAPSERRAVRLVVILVVLAGVGIVGLSFQNRSKLGLRCVEGFVVPYRGRTLPWGRVELAESRLGPLAVSPDSCTDETFGSTVELEQRYTEIALAKIDDALGSQDRAELDAALAIIGTLEQLIAHGDPRVEARRDALEVARLRAEVEHARATKVRAGERLKQARDDGVDSSIIEELERILEPSAEAELNQVEEPKAGSQGAGAPPPGRQL